MPGEWKNHSPLSLRMRALRIVPVAVPLLLLVAACMRWLGAPGESENAPQVPMAYRQLSEAEQEALPPFAHRIYAAQYAHWQVGEWAWRFDVPPGSETQLRLWVGTLGGQAVAASSPGSLSHMKPPIWWSKPADARLVSNRRLDARRMSMWFSPSQNRVWLLYCKL